jgi:CheY-like chemotaxis protein
MLAEMGYEVVEADSGTDALALIDVRIPDLVITDHLMPGLSGTDLALILAAERPGLPVLIVSGYADLDGLPPDLPRLPSPSGRPTSPAASPGSAKDADTFCDNFAVRRGRAGDNGLRYRTGAEAARDKEIFR